MTCYLCTQPISTRQKVERHHPIYKSKGGTHIKPCHIRNKRCHRLHACVDSGCKWAELTDSFREYEANKGKAAKMNRQARVLFNFISSSSSDNFLARQETSVQRSYYQRLIYSFLSRSIYKTEGFESLGRQFANIAR